eukprot:335071-Rhodomonas_salina.1
MQQGAQHSANTLAVPLLSLSIFKTYSCLFHRQFKRGKRWDSMHKDPHLETKIKRVVAICIFDRPPQNSSLQELLPWCAFEAWGSEELECRCHMLTDDGKERGGIEFVDINL